MNESIRVLVVGDSSSDKQSAVETIKNSGYIINEIISSDGNASDIAESAVSTDTAVVIVIVSQNRVPTISIAIQKEITEEYEMPIPVIILTTADEDNSSITELPIVSVNNFDFNKVELIRIKTMKNLKKKISM